MVERIAIKPLLLAGLIGCVLAPIPATFLTKESNFWALLFPVRILIRFHLSFA
jgi:hypothetical protein